jgi:hypothetical protein
MSGNNYLVTCNNCAKSIPLRGKAMTIAMTCPECGKYFRVKPDNKENLTFVNPDEPAIPIGSKGTIDGTKYEVMGFVVKKETKYHYRWREYLLFNPFQGYAFLSESDGHWNFIWPVEDFPFRTIESPISYEGVEYKLYSKYSATVVYARGEFFFDVVETTENTFNKEYVSPPFLLGREDNEDSSLVYKGEYLTPREVADAFKLPVSKLPGKTGVGYTQPMKVNFKEQHLVGLTVMFLALALLIQILLSTMAENRKVWRLDFSPSAKDEKVLVSPTFELEGYSRSLLFDVYSPVQNDWLVADFSLVNENDGTEYNFTKEISYYSGIDGGESWSEGSRSGEAYLSQIPAGKYHINLYPEFGTTPNPFSVNIEYDIPAWSNFFWFAFALLIFPAGYYWYKHWFEVRRWSDSEYTPYE